MSVISLRDWIISKVKNWRQPAPYETVEEDSRNWKWNVRKDDGFFYSDNPGDIQSACLDEEKKIQTQFAKDCERQWMEYEKNHLV